MQRGLFDQMPFGVIVTTECGEICFINDLATRMVGLKEEIIKSRKILELIPESMVIKSIKTGHPNIISIHHEDHQPIILFESKITGEDGGPLGLIMMFHASFVEHLAYFCKKIGDLKQELDLIMNLVGELVTITDAEGRILRVNEACERIMGVTRNEFEGKPFERLEEEKILDNSSTKQVIAEGRNVTVVQTTKSGRRLLVNGYPIFDEKGQLKKVINISKDITETEQLSEKLAETKKLLQEYEAELTKKIDKETTMPVIKSRAMIQTNELITRMSKVDSTVLFTGESGVGKEFFARTLHNKSNRSEYPFVPINFGGIPEEIIESELFGDPHFGTSGLIEEGNYGTIFFNEIEKLPLHIQLKLFHVLRDKKIGTNPKIDLDVRIVSATDVDLQMLVEQQLFRNDLYYLLNVVPIHVPSLTERKEEIPFLVQHFLTRFNEKYNLNKSFSPELMNFLIDYHWGGNVRELENTVERLVVTVPSEIITIEHLPNNMVEQSVFLKNKNLTLKEALDQYEKEIIEGALNNCLTMKEASIQLGVDASTLSRKVRKFGLIIA